MTNINAKGSPAPADYFTGSVTVAMAVKPEDGVNATVGNVRFRSNARTNWHTHLKGQILIVTEGLGYYQEKDGPIQVIKSGDVIKIAPGVVHWHGASHQQAMTHIAIVPDTSADATNWMQPVTDAEYNSFRES